MLRRLGVGVLTSALASYRAPLGASRALCASAKSADSVLTFWFGEEWSEGGMETDEYRKASTRRWFMGGKRMDERAQRFVPLIRAAGSGELTGDEWEGRDGLVAQLVLLDQLSRNAFRGTEEAFAYDGNAQRVACRLAEQPGAADLPAPAALFVATALMHSESIALHDACRRFLEEHVAKSASPLLRDQLERDLPAHTAVLDRFGRYPHRNRLKRRASTEEEERWLASDECPGWATSQLEARQPGTSPRELMSELIVVDRRGACAAHAALASRAVERWPEWTCAPATFEESRWWEGAGRKAAAEERCLVTAGRATLWPHGGGDAVEIAKGDWVTFKRGFLCEWHVRETIAKRFAYFDAHGAEIEVFE